MAVKTSFGNRVFRTLASVKTGIILLIVLGVVAAAGTLILQRPMTGGLDRQGSGVHAMSVKSGNTHRTSPPSLAKPGREKGVATTM
ncbi:MAG: hypothetical protein ACXVZI_12735, partial [Terriglobales bacterium]